MTVQDSTHSAFQLTLCLWMEKRSLRLTWTKRFSVNYIWVFPVPCACQLPCLPANEGSLGPVGWKLAGFLFWHDPLCPWRVEKAFWARPLVRVGSSCLCPRVFLVSLRKRREPQIHRSKETFSGFIVFARSLLPVHLQYLSVGEGNSWFCKKW